MRHRRQSRRSRGSGRRAGLPLVPAPGNQHRALRARAAGAPMNADMLRGTEAPAVVAQPAGKTVTVPVTGAPLVAPAIPRRTKPDDFSKSDDFSDALYRSMVETERATVAAHEAYLRFS